MPRPEGITPDSAKIDILVQEFRKQGKNLKDITPPGLQKALYRARKGQPISRGSLNLIAQALKVDPEDILPDGVEETPEARSLSLRCAHVQNLKDAEKTWFSAPSFSQMDIVVPTEVDARFLVEDPGDEQTELAAQIIEAIEKLIQPMRPSEMIRTKGSLNSAIKKCQALNIALYGCSYHKRMGAWPYWDADQTEKAKEATPVCLLVVFAQGPAGRSVQQPVELGSSAASIQEDVEWLDDLIQRARSDQADEEEVRCLERLREEAKRIFIDHRI